LLFKSLIKDLTKSEIHAVMTEGFGTVAGTLISNDPSYIVQFCNAMRMIAYVFQKT
jgi:nucleoside permease NupC